MIKQLCIVSILTFILFSAAAQNPLRHWTDPIQSRYSSKQPVVNYLIRVDKNDLTVFSIEMHIRHARDTFRVAMVAHPEYDDRYWRFIEHMVVETKTGKGSVQRKDSALWQVVAPGGELVLRYQLRLPPPDEEQRASWRPFLSARGGLTGGPHCFLYVVGSTLAPSHVTFSIPEGWKIATGLEPTPDPFTFYAPSAAVLVDCPVLIGQFTSCLFKVDGVPHQLVYYASADTIHVDTARLVHAVQKLAVECLSLFGRLPYRSYTFLFFDDAYGALEHANSVTIGAPARLLQEDFSEVLIETAHEYFHAWNLVRIRPAERTDAVTKRPNSQKDFGSVKA
ncbi:MAG: hypothetical protein INR73_01575 [Williamsia sp.]|nr:hypothetical protein [Williamsia sp.]